MWAWDINDLSRTFQKQQSKYGAFHEQFQNQKNSRTIQGIQRIQERVATLTLQAIMLKNEKHVLLLLNEIHTKKTCKTLKSFHESHWLKDYLDHNFFHHKVPLDV